VQEKAQARGPSCETHDGDDDAEYHVTAVAESCPKPARETKRRGKESDDVYSVLDGLERISLSVGTCEIMHSPPSSVTQTVVSEMQGLSLKKDSSVQVIVLVSNKHAHTS
jgi:hypothetical protein